MLKRLIALMLLCLIAATAAAEENACIGSWTLTARGDTSAAIGSERLALFEDGEGIWAHSDELTAVTWTQAEDTLNVTANGESAAYTLQDGTRLTAQDGRSFERPMDASTVDALSGVWTLERAVLEERRVNPQDVRLDYRLILLPDGTGLFSGDGIDSTAVTWIAHDDDLHVHGDGQCMLFQRNGELLETEFSQINSRLVFARTGAIEAAADVQRTVRATSNVNLRSGAGKNYDKLGVANAGDALPYGGETQADDRGVDWYKVLTDSGEAWVSSQYAKIVEE